MNVYGRRDHRYSIISRGRVAVRGNMNATEKAYAQWLMALQAAGEIAHWWFEPLRLRLSSPEAGRGAWYSPDFMVLMPDGLTFLDEVKGSKFMNDASKVRVRCAAEQFPLWKFRLAIRQKKGFVVTEL